MTYIQRGKAKRIILKTPYRNSKKRDTHGIRIVTNRLKQGVFSILGDAVIDAKVLDLYCGIGSFGLEALSMGAKHCDFVDSSKLAIKLVSHNLEKTNLLHRSEVFMSDVEEFVKGAIEFETQYLIIFIDPPYPKLDSSLAISLLASTHKLLTNHGIIVFKHHREVKLPGTTKYKSGILSLDAYKKYAASAVSIYFFDEKCKNTITKKI